MSCPLVQEQGKNVYLCSTEHIDGRSSLHTIIRKKNEDVQLRTEQIKLYLYNYISGKIPRNLQGKNLELLM